MKRAAAFASVGILAALSSNARAQSGPPPAQEKAADPAASPPAIGPSIVVPIEKPEPKPAKKPPPDDLDISAPHTQPPPCGYGGGDCDNDDNEPEFEGSYGKKLNIIGMGEFFYAYNFNNPSNGISNARFDNRHNTFSLSNLAFGFEGELKRIKGRVILQYGLTPDTYYSAEPSRAGSTLASATSASTWKYIQEANVAVDLARHVSLETGLFLSPIGAEAMPVAKNWNWSRSNLFQGLPFYHTGMRVSYKTSSKYRVTEDGQQIVCLNENGLQVPCPGAKPLVDEKDGWVLSAAVFNGWNSVVDNNQAKSVALGADFTRTRNIKGKDTEVLYFHALYFGGIERDDGAKEGAYWRNDLDLVLRGRIGERTSVMAHANGGMEPTRFGPTWWAGGAIYGRQGFNDWLSIAARADVLRQREGSDSTGRATALFFDGARWVSSATVTLEAQASKYASIRLEYRHDEAERPLFYFSKVAGDGVSSPFVANSTRQDTILLGVAATCCDL